MGYMTFASACEVVNYAFRLLRIAFQFVAKLRGGGLPGVGFVVVFSSPELKARELF
jgi:hypothetical protein